MSSTCCSGRTKIGRTCCHDTEKTLKYSIKTDIEPLMFCVSTPSWVFKGSRCIHTGNVWGLTFNSIINDWAAVAQCRKPANKFGTWKRSSYMALATSPTEHVTMISGFVQKWFVWPQLWHVMAMLKGNLMINPWPLSQQGKVPNKAGKIIQLNGGLCFAMLNVTGCQLETHR